MLAGEQNGKMQVIFNENEVFYAAEKLVESGFVERVKQLVGKQPLNLYVDVSLTRFFDFLFDHFGVNEACQPVRNGFCFYLEQFYH